MRSEKEQDKFKRFFNELTEKEQERIRKALSGKERIRVKVVDSWTDDHLPCVGTTVNNIPLSFWWLSGEGSGALHFPNDPKAQKVIRSMIKAEIEMNKDEQEVKGAANGKDR
jgi:hypothetical protein